MKNVPYRKEYNSEGKVSNPITKHKPYINYFPKKQTVKTRHKGNNKGNAIVVVGSLKYFKQFQTIPKSVKYSARTIEHSIVK